MVKYKWAAYEWALNWIMEALKILLSVKTVVNTKRTDWFVSVTKQQINKKHVISILHAIELICKNQWLLFKCVKTQDPVYETIPMECVDFEPFVVICVLLLKVFVSKLLWIITSEFDR